MPIELLTEFKYKIRASMFTFWSEDDIEITLQATPAFLSYNQDITDDCVVLDIHELVASLKISSPAKSYLLTCECGYADDVGITAPILLTHTKEYIYWDLDITHYRAILSLPYAEIPEGILRLIFPKQQYRNAIIRLVKTLQHFILNGVEIDLLEPQDFTRTYGAAALVESIKQEHPQLKFISVDEINPHGCNHEAILKYQF
ncbi:hypothetical protein [Gallibacterium anatis]|uniref:hypothetical protein n=1 Tax=Gallibacterium anatis TaxID=750 RepID=UPI001B3208E4|nr:hypothetical protein [Gallibacterium anatis]MBP4134417.1 hypothetical protein [Gallibacterium anatis]